MRFRIVLGLGAAVAASVWSVACSSSDSGGGELHASGGGPTHGSGGGGGSGGSAAGGHAIDSGYYGGGTGGGGGSYSSGGAAGAYGSGGGGAYPGAAGGAGAGNQPGSEDAGTDAGDSGDADACAALDPEKPVSFFLSADDSNSMASPAIARRLIVSGQWVPPQIIRTYEFLNYYNIGFAPATPGKLAIVPELRAGDDPGSFELGIGVVAPAAQKPRRPMNITFVLDTSGSMGGTPIDLERAAVLAIRSQLQAGDLVSAVTWNTVNAVLLDSHAVTGPNDAMLGGVAASLTAGGGTDLNGGLTHGYALATKNYDPARLNRVVLISDGQANVGITDAAIIGKGAQLNDGDGIYLVGVGVGNGVNDTLMNTVTDKGRGAYVYLDTAGEANKMFGARFDETMDVAARGVQVELKVPWYLGIAKFHGEEYSTNPTEIEPQHLAPDDAMFFDQIVAPCSQSVYSANDPIEVIARWQVPVTHQMQQVSVATTFADLLAKTPEYLPKAAAIVAYAEALKDPGTAGENLIAAKQLVLDADPSKTDPELTEIGNLIDKALTVY